MLKTVQASRASLMVQQLQMATVGNNVANVNTAGYKADKPQTDFTDAVRQAMSANGTTVQSETDIVPTVGTGMRVIMQNKKDFSQGHIKETGRELDVAIDGRGFFEVTDGENTRYTRSGVFKLSSEGDLVTPAGYQLKGVKIPSETKEIIIEKDGSVTAVSYEEEKENAGNITLQYFENPSNLKPVGKNMFSAGIEMEKTENIPEEDKGVLLQSHLEMSNVDLTDEFARMIVSQKSHSFQSKAITTADEMWGIANQLRR